MDAEPSVELKIQHRFVGWLPRITSRVDRPTFQEATAEACKGQKTLPTASFFIHVRQMPKKSKQIPSKKPDAERRLRQADRLARVLRVLQLLQSRGRWNLKAIASELEVSTRTVRRYLDVLELAGVPWTYDKDQECYRLRPDYIFPVINLSENEIIGQATATVTTKASGLDINEGATPTSQKLAASKSEIETLMSEATRFTEVLDLKLADHSKHREIIRTIQWALVGRKQVTGHYKSPYESTAVKLTLHPYRICLIKSAWYLIGKPTDENRPRTYRVARFKSLRMTDEPATEANDFDLRTYLGNAWAVYRGEPTYEVALCFTQDAADVVTETKWHHTQKVTRHKNGTATIKFTIDGLNEILRWVLGWAGSVEVIEPKELRELVVQYHRNAIEANQSN